MTIFIIVNGTALSQATVVKDSQLAEMDITRQFIQFIEDLRRDLKIPGLSAAMVKDGNVLWAKGFGFANIEKKIVATPETSYYLASLTKTFASTIIMQLVEQGKLDLDTPVSTYNIRIFSPGVITVRHLLSHTSEGQPGTFYSYNGYRFQFLGQVIRKASGRSFKDLLIEKILKPLDMTGTAPNMSAHEYSGSAFARVFENLSQPYALDKNGRIVKGHFHRSFGASGGLISTVLDIAKYDIALQQYRLLRPETQEMAFTPFVSPTGERLPYALGWFSQVYNGVRLIWHYGYYSPSISTLILKAPDEKMTLIVLANTDALSRPFPIGDGDVLNSPLAAAFFRMFIFPRKTGRTLAAVNWKSTREEITSQLEQEKDEHALDLYKKEMMSYWRVLHTMGHKEKASRLREVYSSFFPEKKQAASQKRRAIGKQQQVPVVGSDLKLIMMVCFVIFMLGFIMWPVGKGIRFLEKRKTKNAGTGKQKSGLRAAATFIAWLNGVLGLFYVAVTIFRGGLEFLLKNGFGEKQYAEVKLIFATIPLAFGCISILLVCFTFWEWKKRNRSVMGRWFYTVFTAGSLVLVFVCYHWYMVLLA